MLFRSVPWTNSLDPGCTNFTSHALLAGGYSVKSGTHLGASDNCWFYIGMSNRSASWGSVTNFYNFVTWNNSQSNSAPKATSPFSNSNYPFISHPKSSSALDVGDIIQIKFNSSSGYAYPNYGHNVMMTGESTYQGSLSHILITGRTRANQYKKNVKLNDAYPPAPNTNNGSGKNLYRGIKLSY